MNSTGTTNNTLIIGIVGIEGAGKDTLADHLVAEYGFTKYSMAQPIKEIAHIMFGWSDELLNGRSKDQVDLVTGITPREFYKWFGTDIAQHAIHDRFPNLAIPRREMWVHSMRQYVLRKIAENPYVGYKQQPKRSISMPELSLSTNATSMPKNIKNLTLNNLHSKPVRIVIPDIRFLHEARAIRELGGILIHLTTDIPTQAQTDQQASYDIPQLIDPNEKWLQSTLYNPRVSIPDFKERIDAWLASTFNKEPTTQPTNVSPSRILEDIEQHEYNSNLSMYI